MSEVLRRLVPMMVSLGVDARWEVLAGTQEYFVVVNHMLNALQGRDDKITEEMYHIYSTIMERNAKAQIDSLLYCRGLRSVLGASTYA